MKAKPRKKVDTRGTRAALSPEAVKAWDSLTGQQRAFVARYAECRNASKAALEAGYSDTSAANAYRLLKMPAVVKVLKELSGSEPVIKIRQPKAKPDASLPQPPDLVELKITTDWVKQRLAVEAMTAMEGGARVRALAELASLLDMYPARKVAGQVQHNHTHQTIRGILDEIEAEGGVGLPLGNGGKDDGTKH